MAQGPFCPNLTEKVQKEVSQMANHNFSTCDAIRWFKSKLKPLKKPLCHHLKWTEHMTPKVARRKSMNL